MSLPAGVQLLRLATLPRERWRNGRGWTRPVAQQGEGDALRWRVSLAEIGEAATFSSFPGLDRTTVLVDGGPVELCGTEQRWTLRAPGDLARYPGEAAMRNEAPVRPALFWNLMVARGAPAASVEVVDAACGGECSGPLLLWALAGRWTVTGPGEAFRFAVAEGLIAAPTALAGWTLSPDHPGARVLLTRIAD